MCRNIENPKKKDSKNDAVTQNEACSKTSLFLLAEKIDFEFVDNLARCNTGKNIIRYIFPNFED